MVCSVKFILMKFTWLHGFHILARVIFMIGQTAPCWDQINNIIWVAHLLQKLFQIVSLIPISTIKDFTLHYYSLLEIRMWVISIHIYLICIFVVNGSDLPKIQRSLEEGTNGICHFVWNGPTFQPEAKMSTWISNCIFPVTEWSTDTKNGYDD